MLLERRCAGCDCSAWLVCDSCAQAVDELLVNRQLPLRPIAWKPPVGVVRAAFDYASPIDQMILAAKNGGRRDVLRFLAGFMSPDSSAGYDLVSWVPASVGRKRARGFDQSRELARRLGSRLGVPHRRLLLRAPGEAQAGRGRAQRLQGPHFRTFGRPPERILLVDDVTTTGASLARAAGALIDAGAIWVDASVVAAANR